MVDLSEPDLVAAPKMRAACRDYGFLYGMEKCSVYSKQLLSEKVHHCCACSHPR